MAGLGTRKLKLTVDAVDVTAEVSKAVITSNDAGSDFTTFADAAAGGKREYRLEITMQQDVATGALWDQIWSHAGETVDFILDPVGGGTPSPTNPQYEGTCTITEPDGDLLGGEANSSTSARFTVSVAWVCDAKPTKVVA